VASRQPFLGNKPIGTFQVFLARKFRRNNEKKYKISCYLSSAIGEELEHTKKEVSVKNCKIYKFYLTTSFFLVMMRVI